MHPLLEEFLSKWVWPTVADAPGAQFRRRVTEEKCLGAWEAALEASLREIEKALNGTDSQASELIYFKVYKSQIQIIEQAIEVAARMLGSDKSRGYCLEMICADFIAGAHLDGGDPDMLLQSISRYYKFLPNPQRDAFRSEVNGLLS